MASIEVIQSPGGVVADAKSRSLRTLVMGFLFDLVATLSIVLAPLLADLDVSSKAQWMVIGSLVFKTILTSAISYFARLRIAPKEPNQVSLSEARSTIEKIASEERAELVRSIYDRVEGMGMRVSPETMSHMDKYLGRG